MVKYRLVVFDMDGTLVREESSWRKIHKYFDTVDTELSNLKAWERGEIGYDEFMRRDIEAWKPAPHISLIRKILSDYRLVSGVKKVVSEIREREHETMILTGGLDLLAEMVARELGISHFLANGLETDQEGYLSGEGITRVNPRQKDEALENFLGGFEIGMDECVAVGDSPHDKSLLESVGLGVAVGNNEALAESANIVLRDFQEYEKLLEHLLSENTDRNITPR